MLIMPNLVNTNEIMEVWIITPKILKIITQVAFLREMKKEDILVLECFS